MRLSFDALFKLLVVPTVRLFKKKLFEINEIGALYSNFARLALRTMSVPLSNMITGMKSILVHSALLFRIRIFHGQAMCYYVYKI